MAKIIIGNNNSGKTKMLEKLYNIYYSENMFSKYLVYLALDRINSEEDFAISLGTTEIADINSQIKSSSSKQVANYFYNAEYNNVKKDIDGFINEIIDANVDPNDNLVSDGIKSLRIILSICEKYKSNKLILFIDEIDSYLSIQSQSNILPFLKSRYPNLELVTTTHSPYILDNCTIDDKIIKVENNEANQIDNLCEMGIEYISKYMYGLIKNETSFDNFIKEVDKVNNGTSILTKEEFNFLIIENQNKYPRQFAKFEYIINVAKEIINV